MIPIMADKTSERPGPGRPSTYDRETVDRILAAIGKGASLRAACKDEDIPHGTFCGWVVDDVDGIADRYAHACQSRAMLWAEEIVEIADDSSQDEIEDPETGKTRFNSEFAQRSRLRVDTRKWLLSKVLPKVYGDRIDVTSKGEKVGFAIHVDLGERASA